MSVMPFFKKAKKFKMPKKTDLPDPNASAHNSGVEIMSSKKRGRFATFLQTVLGRRPRSLISRIKEPEKR
ncbi:MAG: hypothetical protein ABH821_03875 [archaeon]